MDDMRSNQQVSFTSIAQIDTADPRNSSGPAARATPGCGRSVSQLDAARTSISRMTAVSAAVFYKDLVNWHRNGQFIADFSQFYIPGYHGWSRTASYTPATFEGLVGYARTAGGRRVWPELQTIFRSGPVGRAERVWHDRDHFPRGRSQRRHPRAGPVDGISG
jgi:hypothetical protein